MDLLLTKNNWQNILITLLMCFHFKWNLKLETKFYTRIPESTSNVYNTYVEYEIFTMKYRPTRERTSHKSYADVRISNVRSGFPLVEIGLDRIGKYDVRCTGRTFSYIFARRIDTVDDEFFRVWFRTSEIGFHSDLAWWSTGESERNV